MHGNRRDKEIPERRKGADQSDRQQDETDNGDPAEAHFPLPPQQTQDGPGQQKGKDGQAALTGEGTDRLIPNQPL